MKTVFRLAMVFATATFTFAACNKNEVEAPQSEDGYYYTFAISNPETRSILASDDNGKFGEWETGDRLGTGVNDIKPGYSQIVPGSPVTFKIYKQGGLVEDDVVYAYYPYNGATVSAQEAALQIPLSQNQDGAEFDFDAMPMVAEGFDVPAELASTTNTTNVVGQISLVNLGSVVDFQVYSTKYANETIESIKFAASSAIAGEFKKDITTVKTNDESTLSISGFTETEVTTTITNAPTIGSSRSAAAHCYMVVAPVSEVTGSIIVTTDKANYTFNLTQAQSFKRAGLKSFGLNLRDEVREEITPESSFEWTLVSSADQIVPGAEVVIAAKDAAVAMSQTQNNNNRATAAIAKTGSTITWTEESLVQVFEIEAGSKENTIAFKCANGSEKGHYIYAASSGSNYLRTEKAKSNNSSWTIAISSTDNAVTLLAQGENTRNYLQYNSSNNPPIFSCYASTTTNQDDIVLYIKGEAADPDAKAIISNGTIDVAATGVAADYEGAYSLKNIDEDTETINLTASENILEPFALGGDVTFSMAPNYGSSKVNGSITLSLASDANVSATIPVEQKGSTLKTSVTEVVIPADATETSFTVTSPEFGWSITADNTNVVFTESGEASSSAVTVTVSSEVAATAESQTLATLTISRTENDPQKKTITIKKAEIPTSTEAYVKATSISEGIYLMVYNSKAASSFNNGALVASSVTINNDEIASTSIVDQYAIEIASLGDDQYSLKLGNSFIGYNSSTKLQTGTSVTSDNYKWTITIDDDGTAYIVNVGTNTRYIGGNASGDSFTQFKAYATSGIATYPKPTLYKFTGE